MATALGFRVHTGWSTMVGVRGPSPRVVLRRRLVLAESEDTETNEVYHRARDEGPAIIQKAATTAARLARAGIEEVRATLSDVRTLAVVVGNGRVPDDLGSILRSHPMIHAAEGRLYADAILDAGRRLGLAVRTIPARELKEQMGGLAAIPAPPDAPWGRDEKEGALAAWMALRRRAPAAEAEAEKRRSPRRP